MTNASAIIPTSKAVLWITFIPNKGKLVNRSGSNAQCIAQASDVPIPTASQLMLNLMNRQKYEKAT